MSKHFFEGEVARGNFLSDLVEKYFVVIVDEGRKMKFIRLV